MIRTNFVFCDEYIEMVRGDTLAFGLEIKDQDGTGIELDTATFAAKQDYTEVNDLFRKTLNNGITYDGDGVYKVRVAPEDTAECETGKYFYNLEISKNGDVYTILKGVLAIDMDVTKEGQDV